MCLIVNDDLHKTFERYRALKKGRKPLKFVPGESTQQTLLNPSHVYTYIEREEPKAQQHEDRKSANKAPADVDLFDLMGPASQPASHVHPMMMGQPQVAPMPNMMTMQMQQAMAHQMQQQMQTNQQMLIG